MNHLNRALLILYVILIGSYPLQCQAQSALPRFDPDLTYCIHLKNGKRSCAKGKRFQIQSDGALYSKRMNQTYSLSEIESIESFESRTLAGVGIGSIIGLVTGVTLLVAGGISAGNFEQPGYDKTLLSASILGGTALIIAGPIVGGFVGYMWRLDTRQWVYPTVVTSSSGQLAPGIGISGRY